MKSGLFQRTSKKQLSRILSIYFIILFLKDCYAADLVIQIASKLSQDNSSYRLDYSPRIGNPPPNTTISSHDIVRDVINFSDGLPGTKYEFYLYYSNSSLHDWLTWTASIITDPDPPSNLTVNVRVGKTAIVTWNPPALGHYTGFKMKVLPLVEQNVEPRTIMLPDNASPYTLRDLTPGGTYQVQLFTVYDNKESAVYVSRNFTTKPNTPGKSTVWFRNETTLLVLWQPSYPANIYTHYKVSIDPEDAPESVLYVEKDGDPPGPAQAAFKGLVPGRAYNISVQTVSDLETSFPTKAQDRTIPLRPFSFSVDKNSVTSNSFKVTWEPPKGLSEFDKYQIMINIRRQGPPVPVFRNRDEPTEWEFRENLEAGRTYQVLAKTVSGKVTSWPATVNVTLKPLPVGDLQSVIDEHTGDVTVTWLPDNASYQDIYKVSYAEVEILNGDSYSMFTQESSQVLKSLLSGRNYSITVQAVSNQVESNESTIYQATNPDPPSNLTVNVRVGKTAIVTWNPPALGHYTGFKMKVLPLVEQNVEPRTIMLPDNASPYTLRDLTPGGTYQVQLFTVYDNKESAVYVSRNFTTKPNTPGKSTVWFRNETTLLVLWQPSYPANIYTHYKVSIDPEDAPESVLYVEKDGDPPGPAQAAFKGLVPGRAYNISVQTVSDLETSFPNKAQDRTIPLRPFSFSVDKNSVTSNSFKVTWEPPKGLSEFDKYQIMINIRRQGPPVPVFRNRDEPTEWEFRENLEAGRTYQVLAKTVSGKVTSWPATVNVTLKPLPVGDLQSVIDEHTGDVTVTWLPDNASYQDIYKVSYAEVEILNGDSYSMFTQESSQVLKSLLSGRNYSITVQAVSNQVESNESTIYQATNPEPITVINATQILDTSITLTWDTPNGEYNAFEVQYLNAEGILIQNLTLHDTITIDELKPHHNYTFTVIVRSGTESSILRRSLPVSAIFKTQESVPGKEPAKNLFSSFGGFKTNSSNSEKDLKSTFSFLNSNPLTTNGNQPDLKKYTNAAATTLSLVSNSSIENKSVSSPNTINGKKYPPRLVSLNKNFSDWIKSHVDKDPSCILTPVFRDYERYLKELEDEFTDATDSSEKMTNSSPSPSTNSTTSKAAAPLSFFKSDSNSTSTSTFLSKPDQASLMVNPFTNKQSKGEESAGSGAKGFSFNANSQPSSTPSGFSFGGTKPFTFGNVSATPVNSNAGDGEAEAEESDELRSQTSSQCRKTTLSTRRDVKCS